ncbi:MAG: C40 family peptidase [Defluviitaleaceae bacterium]|nr:C40 family peptidase [Defluviitaleaceae bacterium]
MMLIINKPIAPIYKLPSASSERVDEALYGNRCKATRQEGGFYYITTSYGYEGYLKMEDATEYKDDESKDFYQIHSNFADVLLEPNVRSQVLFNVPKGAMMPLAKKEAPEGYMAVCLADGTGAYIREKHLKKMTKIEMSESVFRGRVVEAALSYKGTPYRWGGKTPLGIDCSGLTFMAYHLNGVDIWRDSYFKEGYLMRKISSKEAKRGDLVHFPGHVAMLLDGGYIIHSSYDNCGVAVERLIDNKKLADSILYFTTLGL